MDNQTQNSYVHLTSSDRSEFDAVHSKNNVQNTSSNTSGFSSNAYNNSSSIEHSTTSINEQVNSGFNTENRTPIVDNFNIESVIQYDDEVNNRIHTACELLKDSIERSERIKSDLKRLIISRQEALMYKSAELGLSNPISSSTCESALNETKTLIKNEYCHFLKSNIDQLSTALDNNPKEVFTILDNTRKVLDVVEKQSKKIDLLEEAQELINSKNKASQALQEAEAKFKKIFGSFRTQ